ncbi:MAG: DNA-processing protein DprA [Solirubrobacteraceae bacterium]
MSAGVTGNSGGACDDCLARAWLLSRLAGHLDQARDRVAELLTLTDPDLLAAVGGGQRAAIERERAQFHAGHARAARSAAARAGLELVCRCRTAYPEGLRALAAPPAVLHVLGGWDRLLTLVAEPTVAIVGARRPSPYGVAVARSLGRGLAAAGVTVVSGMALGIDGAAHRGALDALDAGASEVGASTVAVLAGGPETPYPSCARALHGRLAAETTIVSELPPGTAVRRWMFPARNRIIAALSAMTVVVEARAHSGALLTAGHAADLGRPLGAVPGRVTSPLTRGPHGLLRAGARLVEGPEDVLEELFGPEAPVRARRARRSGQPALEPTLRALLDALAEGHGTAAALVHAGLDADAGLAALASLELAGRIRREAGGRFRADVNARPERT